MASEKIDLQEKEEPSIANDVLPLEEDHAPKLVDSTNDDAKFLKPHLIHLMKFTHTVMNPKIKSKVSGDEVTQPEKPKMGKCTQKTIENVAPLPYKEPIWSGVPAADYQFEVVKGGVAIESIPLDKPYVIIGRAEQCGIKLDHPSISRNHCIVQYKRESNDEAHPVGMYLYDLGSTHGTYQNKNKVKSQCYSKLNVGHIVKFGLSSRMFILKGPSCDQDEESPYTVTELKNMAEKWKEKAKKVEEEKEDDGIRWGMGDDAVDEDEDLSENPFALNDELSLDDPKKTLRGWFEREGYDLPNYTVEEISYSHFRCKLEIPLNTSGGMPTICVVEHKGKKKDTVAQCALEACRIIDKHGLLRQANHDGFSKKRKKDLSENDFYDSDDDDFLDRTGDIERKRKKRSESSSITSNVENFDSLKAKHDTILEELNKLELKVNEANEAKQKQKQTSEAEDLDDYMNQLGSQMPDRHKLVEWQLEIGKLEKDEFKIRKLLNVARPHNSEEYSGRKSLLRQTHSSDKSNQVKPIILGKKNPGVHKVFLEDEDSPKLKLSKLDDGTADVKAVPYIKPQRYTSKYEELVKLKEKMIKRKCASASTVASVHKTAAEPVAFDNNTCSIEQNKPSLTDNANGPRVETCSELLQDRCNEKQSSSDTDNDAVNGQNNPNIDDDNENTFEFLKPAPVPLLRTPTLNTKKRNMVEKECETWQPPVGQSGDGRTALNDKFGY